jgi:nucleoside-diphosphate-sugar epimerase
MPQGGSGFIAAHVLKKLLARGFVPHIESLAQCIDQSRCRHSVVTTVRSNEKARKIFALYPNEPKSKLDVVVVEDVGNPGAFDKAIISKPPFDVVIHTASPYRFDITDVKTEVLDPAIIGTVGILESIMKYAPSVKRVVRYHS